MRGKDGVCKNYGPDELQGDGQEKCRYPRKPYLPPPLLHLWRLLFKIIKDEPLQEKTKYLLHSRQGASNAGNHEWQNGFRLVLLLQRVCEVFGLRCIAVLLIWFRLEFVADVNKKRAFYH